MAAIEGASFSFTVSSDVLRRDVSVSVMETPPIRNRQLQQQTTAPRPRRRSHRFHVIIQRINRSLSSGGSGYPRSHHALGLLQPVPFAPGVKTQSKNEKVVRRWSRSPSIIRRPSWRPDGASDAPRPSGLSEDVDPSGIRAFYAPFVVWVIGRCVPLFNCTDLSASLFRDPPNSRGFRRLLSFRLTQKSRLIFLCM